MERYPILGISLVLYLLECYFLSCPGTATAFAMSSSRIITPSRCQPLLLLFGRPSSSSFRHYTSNKQRHHTLYMSTIGGGGVPPPPGGGGGGRSSGNNPLDDWLDPKKNLNNSNKYKKRSDARLPISFGKTNIAVPSNQDEDEDDDDDDMVTVKDEVSPSSSLPATTSTTNSNMNSIGTINPINIADPKKMLQTNPYMQVVNSLSPSELIGRFTTTAHPRVQEAVKATILGLIGSLPKMAFDSKVISTGERLASLMFQLQMTGYMFKNAEYRLALTSSLGINTDDEASKQSKFALTGTEKQDIYDPDKTKISGNLKVKYTGLPSSLLQDDDDEDEDDEEDTEDYSSSTEPVSPSLEVEVDAEAYMSELRAEVKRLREDLESRREEREEELRKDLLMYIRTLPQQQLQQLTSTVSPDVLAAMKGLVALVVQNIGGGQIGPNTVTEQSGEAMAQLCMWQLVVGYNLRELEVREEMKSFYLKGKKADIDDGGIIYNSDE